MAKIRYTYHSGGTPAYKPERQPPLAGTPVRDELPNPDEYERTKVDRWWRESSFDLMRGLEVHELPMSALPRAWVDELLKR